jgi:hypothetical protein
MGSLCSKSSTYEGGHTVLGSGPVNSNTAAPSQPASSSQRIDPRAAAAEAAERRLQAVGFSHHERVKTSRIVYRRRKGALKAGTLSKASWLASWRNRTVRKLHLQLRKSKDLW